MVAGIVHGLRHAARRRPAVVRSRLQRTRCTTNPLGVKGCGEAGAIAAFPAIANAIVDALAPLGVKQLRRTGDAGPHLAGDGSRPMRRQAPAAARNRQPILDVLQPHLPARGLVLEVASGSGEHTAHFAQALPDLTFQPSDPDAVARASIDDWTAMLGLANVRPALDLDAAAEAWPIIEADAIACINMIHISPWDSAIGLVRGAARLLPRNGTLFLYGPYFRDGFETAPKQPRVRP